MKNFLVSIALGLSWMLLSCCTPGTERNSTSAEMTKFTDEKTGLEVWQITSHDSISEAFYFYAPSFTADDKYLIFRSTRSGRMEIHRSDLATGEIIQLTDEDVSSASIHPDGRSMIYIADWKFFRMDMYTLQKEMVMDFSGKINAEPRFRPTMTNDGRFTLVYTRQNDTIRLYRVNLETQDILKVMEQSGVNFSHQLINPADPNLITYAPLPDTQNDMTLPMEKRPRARLINVEKGTDEPFLITPYGFRATHDSWSPVGDRYFFFEKSVPGWVPAAIGSIDKNGGDYQKHYVHDTIKLGHGAASQDGQWFISDGQEPFDNPLILINLRDGKSKTLCWPNASIRADLGNIHVHPNFSSSGNYVIYTSDAPKTGTHQVFVVPIKEIKDNWK